MRMVARLFFLSNLILAGAAFAAGTTDPAAPLGSPKYEPSPERPVGFRGDGMGRYPAATPPTVWERKRNGSAYATKGIIWMTPLPESGVGCPIIAGQRIYLQSEVADLVCLDKQSGRILWIRSNPEFEGISEEDRKANPAYAGLAELLPKLTAVNAELVDQLNAQMESTPTAGLHKSPAAAGKKKELEKKIQEQQAAIDKKLFERYWGQAVFGFAGQTPASDGKHVCAFFTTGVSACYDLDGKRKWIARGKGGGSEHGNFASPLLAGNVFTVWANELRGYDVDSGKLLWTNPAKGFNTYGSMFRVQSGNDIVAAFQWGFFCRIRDGKMVWDQGLFGDSVTTPLYENGVIYTSVGYPKYNHNEKSKEDAGFRSFKVPASTDSGKLTPGVTFKTEWADDEIPAVKDKSPFNRGYVASPLLVDGLIYRMTQAGGLIVNDAATGALVYRKVLPMKAKTQYWNWAGASTSPTFAGKYIYLMDNQGTTVVIAPGREYKEVAINLIEESKDGKEQAQNLASPIFEGTRMYYRSPSYLYCIGEK